MYELGLDTLGDAKTALFLIMSDTDDTFNFLISLCYSSASTCARSGMERIAPFFVVTR